MNTTTWIATAIGALFCYAVFLLVIFSILTVASRADDAMDADRATDDGVDR